LLGGGTVDEIRRAADLGDAFAQAGMAAHTGDEQRLRGLKNLLLKVNAMVSSSLEFVANMEWDASKTCKKARENYLVAAELGDVDAMERFGFL
jgi:hypothetical protein